MGAPTPTERSMRVYHTEKVNNSFVFPAKQIIKAYLEKTEIEDAFKLFLKICPFYINTYEHIRAVYTPKLKNAFNSIGQKLPEIWNTSILSTSRKKALLRCLIDKVVIHRSHRDQVLTRIVWKGGATTTMEIQINVGSFAELSCAKELEHLILQLGSQ